MKITKNLYFICNILIPIFLLTINVKAKTIFVDLTLGTDCVNYYPEARSCGEGIYTAYNSLSDGMSTAEAGDTIILRSGEYEQLRVSISGIAIEAYENEAPVISGLSGSIALWLEDVSFVTIKGISIENCQGFGHIYNCNNITIEKCIFNNSTGSGTSSGLKFNESSNCRIFDSVFSFGGGDIIVMQNNSNYNVIEGNKFENSVHSLLSIRCCSYNVIRNNIFFNEDQKAIEVYDCEGTSDAPYRLNDTKHNLFEKNEFIFTRADTDDHSYNAIQHCAQYTIVRYNLFRNCLGGGVNYQRYSDECLDTYKNRMYNNTFYDNRCYAIIGDKSYVEGEYYDNRALNNLLYKNADCSGGDGQVRIEDVRAVILVNNTEAVSSPGFVDEENKDFHLAENSSQIDKGIFVTQVTSPSGSGSIFTVDDASWFHDGFGIDGESGDLIQFEGQGQSFRIVSLNYDTNVIMVGQTVSWEEGQGVHLAYAGSSPDVGAFEYEQTTTTKPRKPENLKILK